MKKLFKGKKLNEATPAVIYVESFEMSEFYKERNKFFTKQFTKAGLLLVTAGIVTIAILNKVQAKDL